MIVCNLYERTSFLFNVCLLVQSLKRKRVGLQWQMLLQSLGAETPSQVLVSIVVIIISLLKSEKKIEHHVLFPYVWWVKARWSHGAWWCLYVAETQSGTSASTIDNSISSSGDNNNITSTGTTMRWTLRNETSNVDVCDLSNCFHAVLVSRCHILSYLAFYVFLRCVCKLSSSLVATDHD